MQFKSLTGLIRATSAIAAVTFATTDVKAATSANMGAAITSVTAATVNKVSDIDFGKWLLNYNAQDIVLTLDPRDNKVTVGALTTSTAQQLNNSSSAGRLTVNLPAGLNNYVMGMTVTAPTAFTDAAYTLTSLSYVTAVESTPTPITADGTQRHNVTVRTGNTPEMVYFGGVLTVSATPATGQDTGSTFTVDFAY